MKIRKLGIIIGLIAFAIYVVGGALISTIALRSSLEDVTQDLNKTVSTLVADLVSEPLRLGSFVEARTRIESFMKQGLFHCAELSYDGMPISKCESTEGLRPFPTVLHLNSESGAQNPVLVTYVNEDSIRASAFSKGISLVGFVFAFGFVFLMGIIYLLSRVGTEINAVSNELAGSTKTHKLSPIYEINLLRSKMNEYVTLKNAEIESQALLKISKQVAHDIRSPLSAMEMALKTSEIPEERREILTQVARRIRGIANDLLKQSRETSFNQLNASLVVNSEDVQPQVVPVELSDLIRSIISEKSATSQDLQIQTDIPDTIKVQANEVDLGRVISNLLNNSIESLMSGTSPRVEVTVKEYQTRVAVYIKDNGKGIPEAILAYIGQTGFSHGKEKGNGLGVSYAKAKLAEWGGSLQIFSKENEGTLVTLNFLKP